MKESRSIWKFKEPYGDFQLTGIFTATKSRINELMNKSIFMDDLQIVVELGEDNVEFISDDQNLVEKFESLNMETGVNPLRYQVIIEM